MESMNDRHAYQIISDHRGKDAHHGNAEYPVLDIATQRAAKRGLRPQLSEPSAVADISLRIVLMIQDNVRRYSVEGMLHSTNIEYAVTSINDISNLEQFTDCQLIISSSTTSEPVSPDVAANLHSYGTRPLILVDSAEAVDRTWADCAHGFIDWSDLCPETLGQALSDIAGGRFYVSPTLARRSVTSSTEPADVAASNPPSMITLTPREDRVVRLLAEGLSNRQIAKSLGISEHGVKRAVGLILAKLNCPNRTLAAVKGIELGLIDMEA